MIPGSVGGLAPDGPDWLVRTVRELQREVAMLRTAIPANATSLYSKTTSAIGVTFAGPPLGDATPPALTQHVPVPVGFTKATVMGIAVAFAMDFGMVVSNSLSVATRINGAKITSFGGGYLPWKDSETVEASAVHAAGGQLSGLTAGSTFPVDAIVTLDSPLAGGPSQSASMVELTVQAIFTR